MEQYKRINDDEVFKMIEKLNSSEDVNENVMKDVMVVKLKLLLDIRQFLRKMYKNLPKNPKVYKRPTGNSKDVVVGEEGEK